MAMTLSIAGAFRQPVPAGIAKAPNMLFTFSGSACEEEPDMVIAPTENLSLGYSLHPVRRLREVGGKCEKSHFPLLLGNNEGVFLYI
jgi:hypothetical protein